MVAVVWYQRDSAENRHCHVGGVSVHFGRNRASGRCKCCGAEKGGGWDGEDLKAGVGEMRGGWGQQARLRIILAMSSSSTSIRRNVGTVTWVGAGARRKGGGVVTDRLRGCIHAA